MGMELGAAAMENKMEVPQQLKIKIGISSNSYFGYLTKEYENANLKNIYSPRLLQRYLQ